MGHPRRLTLFFILLALSCAGGLGWQLWQARQIARYNAAVARQAWDEASGLAGVHGRFARAYAREQQGQWQQALQVYGLLEAAPDTTLRSAVQFNMANAYLRQALALDRQAQGDLVLPLVELAKQGYRELLRREPQHWDAKYNLERALQLVPDPPEQPVRDWQTPEHGPRAIISLDAEAPLP